MKTPLNICLFKGITVIFPVIDFLNGLFLSVGLPIPIGALYRFMFLLFLVSQILSASLPKVGATYITVLFIIGNLMIFLLQSIFLQNPLSWISADLSVYMRYFLWVLIPYYIFQRRNEFQKIDYEQLFITISFLFTIGLLIPYFLGLGNQTYGYSDVGYKGFFYANNGISFAFIISITFTAHKLLLALKKTWGRQLLFLTLLFFSNVFCLLLIGTKTGIIYGSLVFIYVFIRAIIEKNYPTALHRIFIWLISTMAVLWLALSGIQTVLRLIIGTYERIVYFYHLFNGDLVRLLTSSRSDFFEGGLYYFMTDPNIKFTYFFGQGFEYRLMNFGRLGLIEMDYLDAFFSLGLVGIVILLATVFYYIYIAFYKSFTLYSYVLVITLGYSFFVGHVLFSALSSTLLGLVCGGIILKWNELNKQ